MLNRREFVQVAAAAGATLAVSSSGAIGAEPAAAAAALWPGVLSEHRVAKIESRGMQDRFPRSLGIQQQRKLVGGGAATRFRSSRRTKALRGGPCRPPNRTLLRSWSRAFG